jgi:hypothetical protein
MFAPKQKINEWCFNKKSWSGAILFKVGVADTIVLHVLRVAAAPF